MYPRQKKIHALKETQMYTGRCMDKQTVVCPYNGTPRRNKNEHTTHAPERISETLVRGGQLPKW